MQVTVDNRLEWWLERSKYRHFPTCNVCADEAAQEKHSLFDLSCAARAQSFRRHELRRGTNATNAPGPSPMSATPVAHEERERGSATRFAYRSTSKTVHSGK